MPQVRVLSFPTGGQGTTNNSISNLITEGDEHFTFKYLIECKYF